MVQPLWRSLADSYKTEHTFYHVFQQLPSLVFTKMSWKTSTQTKTCIQILITALFIIGRTWKEPEYLSVGGWMKCGLFQQYGMLYPAIKRNELSDHEKTWRHFTSVLLIERTNLMKRQQFNCMFPTLWHFGRGKPCRKQKDQCLLEVGWRDKQSTGKGILI